MADNFAFGDIMDEFFGKGPSGFGSQFPTATKEEKGVPWEAKEFGGQIYVPYAQVAELLKLNNVLPKMQKRITDRVQAQADKNALDI